MAIASLNSASTGSATLATLLGNGSSSGSSATDSTLYGVTSATSAEQQALKTAAARIDSSLNASSAQLSAFGVLKSAVASVESASAGLTQASASTSASQLTQSMADFFNSFNAAVGSAGQASASFANPVAAGSATRVARDLEFALASNTTLSDAMRTLGLSVNSDGVLKQDASVFAANLKNSPDAVASAMATIGKAVQSVATQDLASGGAIASGASQLAQQQTALTAQYKALLSLESSLGIATSDSSSAATSATDTTTTATATSATATNGTATDPNSIQALAKQLAGQNISSQGIAAYLSSITS